ncbi:GTP cyclohydrolase I FolE [Oceanicoccus sagamiensis]|uniref:GTP cyclohydrolase 1 n=2 Tax=Oceanicoccus sagamiensis TaxID=716816 RepID=A0A1X9NQL8_9GAMM|nr:GTP cyclohydrolase I FolE [Oceanicoccus sagamiensis]
MGQPIKNAKDTANPEDSLENMITAFEQIIDGVGEDRQRDGLLDTPKRAAKAMQFLTKGYDQTVEEIVNGALFESDANEMVLVSDIELYSMCEHHMLPFIGKCHVAYIPNGKVVGLSKIARIVDMYARRLQIQESLTSQIGRAIMDVTGAAGVGVIIEAKHMCMMMRGVEKQNSVMRTSSLMGSFRDNDKTRAEFLSLVNPR